VRLIAYDGGGGTRFAAVDEYGARDAGSVLTDPRLGQQVDLTGRRHLPAVGNPRKIICVGLNYADHAAEANLPTPEEPLIFAKFPSSLCGDGDPIRIPGLSAEIDYEGELAVVIGRRTRGATGRSALEAIFGYTCLNDVSARDIQRRDGQFVRAKSLDTFCPVGPVVVTADEIEDPARLTLTTRVNGQVVQHAPVTNMIFSVQDIVEFVSHAITLEPGDVIATGTPAGVGVASTPPRFLRPGDTVDVEIDNIGVLHNRVVADRG
jgi:2-keto-4-pentenoate hydratase/2-oxohepta-3-ene-1,7-dioic acid hydratase in catechol pathway